MATLVQQDGSQVYLRGHQPEVFNRSENDGFNFSGFLEQVTLLEKNRVEILTNNMMYKSEHSDQQTGSQESNDWNYQARVNDSFNKGNMDHSYQEQTGFSSQDEFNHEAGGYNYDTSYNGGGSGYIQESHGLYESEVDLWSPHSKFNRRQSQGHGFQTLQDLINSSKAEDIPFTADDFPSLRKDPVKSRLPRIEKNWASGWVKHQRERSGSGQPINQSQVQHEQNPGQMESARVNFQWHAPLPWQEKEFPNAVLVPTGIESLTKMHPVQPEPNSQISFQWLESECQNMVVVPNEIENLSEGRAVPIFHQFRENFQEVEKFQLPLFTPPEPHYYSQSVANWNNRELRAVI